MKYYKVLKECFYDGRKFGPIVMIDKAYERPSPQRLSIVRFADDVKPPAVFFEPVDKEMYDRQEAAINKQLGVAEVEG